MNTIADMGFTAAHRASLDRNIDRVEGLLRPVAFALFERIAASPESRALVAHVSLDRLAEVVWVHWMSLFRTGVDEDYMRRVTRIGLAHRERRITPKIYMGSYGWLAARIVDELARSPDVANEDRADLIGAVLILILTDMTMAVGGYDAAALD